MARAPAPDISEIITGLTSRFGRVVNVTDCGIEVQLHDPSNVDRLPDAIAGGVSAEHFQDAARKKTAVEEEAAQKKWRIDNKGHVRAVGKFRAMEQSLMSQFLQRGILRANNDDHFCVNANTTALVAFGPLASQRTDRVVCIGTQYVNETGARARVAFWSALVETLNTAAGIVALACLSLGGFHFAIFDVDAVAVLMTHSVVPAPATIPDDELPGDAYVAHIVRDLCGGVPAALGGDDWLPLLTGPRWSRLAARATVVRYTADGSTPSGRLVVMPWHVLHTAWAQHAQMPTWKTTACAAASGAQRAAVGGALWLAQRAEPPAVDLDDIRLKFPPVTDPATSADLRNLYTHLSMLSWQPWAHHFHYDAGVRVHEGGSDEAFHVVCLDDDPPDWTCADYPLPGEVGRDMVRPAQSLTHE